MLIAVRNSLPRSVLCRVAATRCPVQPLTNLAASQGAALMYLETATTNKAAIALWKKHGYRETATIENYYGRGQHAFEMQKLLAQDESLKARNAAES